MRKLKVGRRWEGGERGDGSWEMRKIRNKYLETSKLEIFFVVLLLLSTSQGLVYFIHTHVG